MLMAAKPLRLRPSLVTLYCALGFGAFGCAAVHAQQQPDPASELRRQQERSQSLEKQLSGKARDVQGDVPVTDAARLAKGEEPCFVIHDIPLVSADQSDDGKVFGVLSRSLDGPHHDDSPIGQCLGTHSISLVLRRAQDALIARGWVTSHVALQPQDLSSGTLTLTVVPGRIHDIRVESTVPRSLVTDVGLANSMVLRKGDILNLRAIEQATEAFKRVPSAEVAIKIAPASGAAAESDDSDLLVSYQQSTLARFTVTLDDSGTKASGKHQGSATLSLDNPMGLSDLFYLTLNHDAQGRSHDYGTQGNAVHYSIPYGYWSFAATANNSRYHQTVAGLSQNYTYSGSSSNADLQASNVVYRDASRKTTLSVKAWQRKSSNFIDDTEVEVQRRQTGGWELGIAHKEFVGAATVEGKFNLKRGTADFGSIAAPEEAYGEGTSKFGLMALEASVNWPFKLAGQQLQYSGTLRAQDSNTRLTAQDYFSIGSRYTVRGFDGETTLAAEHGWLIRNDLATPLGDGAQQIYLGLDFGRVSGPSGQTLLGTTLAGAVIGVRGSFKKLQYDVFVGAPFKKPEGFATASTTAGFSLTLGL